MSNPNRPGEPDFSEDDTVLAQLTDAMDVQAFSNLMEIAHRQGQSAASFIRSEPDHTSRKVVRNLCLRHKRRTTMDRLRSAANCIWSTRGAGNGS